MLKFFNFNQNTSIVNFLICQKWVLFFAVFPFVATLIGLVFSILIITILGVTFSFVFSIYQIYRYHISDEKSKKKLYELDKRNSSLEEALKVSRTENEEIESITIDGGDF